MDSSVLEFGPVHVANRVSIRNLDTKNANSAAPDETAPYVHSLQITLLVFRTKMYVRG